MTVGVRAVAPLVVVFSGGCLMGQTKTEYESLAHVASAERAVSRTHGGPSDATVEAELAKGARLETILRLARAHNPDLAETRARVRAALERVRSSSRLPDLELKYEQWAVPLARPWALNEASTIMVGLRQEFPAPSSLRARSRAALEDAYITQAGQLSRELDIVAQVKRAYYDSYRAEREYWLHIEHVKIASGVVELTRSNYRAGRGTQQDILRAIVELSRLHTDIADIEQQRTIARVMLNTLMARPPDAPLGPPPELRPSDVQPRIDQLERQLETARPDLISAAHTVKRSEASLAAARSTTYWPRFMVGADYWYLPTAMAPATQHAYSAMVSINLPWLNPRHWEDLREAEHTLEADRRALDSVRNVSLFQLHEAAAKLKAAQESFAVLDRDLLPQAVQSFEASRAGYSAGQGDAVALLDAFRSYLQVRLDREKALARVESSLADLERAAGLGRERVQERTFK